MRSADSSFIPFVRSSDKRPGGANHLDFWGHLHPFVQAYHGRSKFKKPGQYNLKLILWGEIAGGSSDNLSSFPPSGP